MKRLLAALVLLALGVACGETPTPPPPGPLSVTVTVSGPIRMGQTAQATATETMSNGQTKAITSGFLSDATAVATVTTAGLVTGVANGDATIFVNVDGLNGNKRLRVVPDYQGRWSGGLRVTSCTETGIFADIDFCDDSPAGATYDYSLNLSQTGEQMNAVVDYGAPYIFPSIAAPIRVDGTSAFAPTIDVNEQGITLKVEAAFTINSTRVGELTGTCNELWRFPNVPGEARLNQDLVSTTRTGVLAMSTASAPDARRLRLIRRLAQRLRER